MIYVFYFFAAVLVWLSFKSFIGGIRYLRFFRRELSKPPSNYKPFITVIAPCRGVDNDLEENLRAVFDQDYPLFEIIFVVDSPADPAVRVIESCRQSGRSPVVSEIVIAPKAVACGQKVENLREGVTHASSNSEVLVFVDSDARPSPGWLRSLVAPLEDKGVGASTGYRWFISRNRSFSGEMLSVWNASIASALGPNRKSNFCWGGSTAIRRETFQKVGILEKWMGAVSDDFVLADAVKAAGYQIAFVPGALTASFPDAGVRRLIEFTNRQMKLTRVYAPRLWMMTLVGCGLFNAVMISALLIIIFSRTNDLPVWLSIVLIAAIGALSVGKSWLRLRAVRLALPQYAKRLREQFWTQNTLWALSPALFFLNSLVALFSRRITWRGITYELKSPNETVIISPK